MNTLLEEPDHGHLVEVGVLRQRAGRAATSRPARHVHARWPWSAAARQGPAGSPRAGQAARPRRGGTARWRCRSARWPRPRRRRVSLQLARRARSRRPPRPRSPPAARHRGTAATTRPCASASTSIEYSSPGRYSWTRKSADRRHAGVSSAATRPAETSARAAAGPGLDDHRVGPGTRDPPCPSSSVRGHRHQRGAAPRPGPACPGRVRARQSGAQQQLDAGPGELGAGVRPAAAARRRPSGTRTSTSIAMQRACTASTNAGSQAGRDQRPRVGRHQVQAGRPRGPCPRRSGGPTGPRAAT